MKRHNIQTIRAHLVRKFEDLQKASKTTVKKLRSDHGKSADTFDQVAIESDRTIELAIRDKDRKSIQDIQETIMRIDHGLFGICEHCGAEISKRRLLIAPTTRFCVRCKIKIELFEKRISKDPHNDMNGNDYAA